MPISSIKIERLNFELEDELVKVRALKDYTEVHVDGITIRLVKDRISEMPYWIAEMFEEEGLVYIEMEQEISHAYMAQLAHQEGTKRLLNKIDSLLFRRVNKYITKLQNENTPIAHRKLTSIEGNYNKLLRLRFKKLLNLAMTDNSGIGNVPLTMEEEWLYEELNKMFKVWHEKIGESNEI